jgi:2-polyprenyl-3-methyl-5-hydroxy-6-metoxy-1,4-benzoquinol methylase
LTDLRRMVGEMSMAVWGLSALSTALEAGLLDELADPSSPETLGQRTGVPVKLVEELLGVLVALGVVQRQGEKYAVEPEVAAAIAGPGKQGLLAELRSTHLQTYHMIEQAKLGALSTGWTYSDPAILQAQGARSAVLVDAWVKGAIPTLEGLESRLGQPGAAFLDVGAGVGALAISMCRHFPNLRAVGIDPFEAALVQGRTNVESTGLSDRIELRPVAVQDLDEQAVYDLAQLPVMFLSAVVLGKGLAAVREALRPGGWVMLQVLAAPVPGDDLVASVLRLVCVLWGSEPTAPERVVEMLKEAGYVQPAVLPPVPGPPVRYVVGRRPLDHAESTLAEPRPIDPGTAFAH